MSNIYAPDCLHDKTKTISDGTELNISRNIKIGVQIYGTSTDCTIIPQISIDKEQWYDIGGIDTKTQKDIYSTITTSGTEINKAFEFDIEHWGYFRCKVTAINNGYVTIKVNRL